MSHISDPRRHYMLDFLGGSNGTQFVIPVYQRNYVWVPNIQVKDLLEDINKNLKDKKRYHFIGIVIYLEVGKGSGTERKFYIIDGQQRLTTIFLILYALLKLSEEQNNNNLSGELRDRFLTNPYVKDDKLKVKLKPLMNDSDIYEKIAYGKTESLTKKERNSNIAKSFDYILKYLIKLNKTYSLEEIRDSINRLYLVDFPLGPNDNAHQIYESINAKGSKLLSVDLIRNFILMNTKPEEKEELYENKWFPIENKFENGKKLEDFFRFFLINKTRDFVSKNNIYDEFQNWYYRSVDGSEMRELLDEIDIFSDYYLDLYKNDINGIDKKIRNVLKEFRVISSDMPAPFMMEVYLQYKTNVLSSYDFNEITDIIISFIVRRAIIGLDTSGITRFFTSLIRRVYENVDIYNTNFLEATKITIINNNTKAASRMPTDSELWERLQNLNVYDNRDALKWVFDKIENDNNPLQIDTSKLQIEHLLPQSNTKWINELGISEEKYAQNMNRLGNLTLATQKDNIVMSNNLFDYKKQILQDSAHLRMNIEILNLKKWDIEEIDKRTNSLIELIITLYKYNSSKSIIDDTEKEDKSFNKPPRMKQLIEDGLIKIGDKIYLTMNKEGSMAELTSASTVLYKGEQITLNKWGQKISGWKSIRIYSYLVIDGENQTLQEKREKFYEA